MSILTLNVGEALSLDGPVAEIEVQVGQVMITDRAPETPSTKIISADDDDKAPVIHDCGGSAGILLYSVTGTRLNVVYTLDVKVAPTREEIAVRGDTGGTEGSFESCTVEELLELAQERDVKGRSKMDKAELVAALREDT